MKASFFFRQRGRASPVSQGHGLNCAGIRNKEGFNQHDSNISSRLVAFSERKEKATGISFGKKLDFSVDRSKVILTEKRMS